MASPLSLYFDQFCEVNAPEADLVLVHGWGMNSLVWDRLMPLLLTKYRVTLIDLPGMGRSPIPSGTYDLDYVAQHLLSVAPEKAVWVGWSLGGLIAMRIAGMAPERVAGLVSIAASPKFVSDEYWPGVAAESLAHFAQWVEEDWQGSLIRFLALQCKGSASHKEDVRFLKERLFHHGLPAKQALRAGLALLADSDLRSLVQQLSVPMGVLLGGRDEVVPCATASELSQLNAGMHVHVIEAAAHIPMVSHASDCLQCINRVVTASRSPACADSSGQP